MRLTVVGCGDAFGSGGRLQTCFHVEREQGAFLIDCGATALIGHQKLGLDPAKVETILISHLHGDHFSGLVWWLLRAVYVEKRTAPLVVAGPRGIETRVWQACEALFAGAFVLPMPFPLSFVEMTAGERCVIGGLAVTPFEVSHPSGAPSHALRIEADGRVLAFSGDTEWVEALAACGRNADFFVCECFGLETPTAFHMTWQLLQRELPRIAARRTMITHMSNEMLAATARGVAVGVIVAEDGLVVDI